MYLSRSKLLLVALILFAAPAVAADKPNVVVIVIDTLRADHLGSYGYKRPTSPRLDALAAGGVRFAQSRSTSGWTAPSVASIFTGLYPNKHGLQLPGGRLGPKQATLAEAFRAAGYKTGAYSANPAFVSARQAFDKGFDEFFVLSSGTADEDDADIMPGGPMAGNAVRVAAANQVSDLALEWLARNASKPQPFFLYLHYFDPHGGYYPPPEFAERFGVSKSSPMLKADQHEYWKKAPDPETLKTLEALYDGEIAFTDFQIGRVLDALPKEAQNWVVVTADHGEEFLDHGGMSHGRTLFEEMLRVPLIIAGPGLQPVVIEQPVVIADIWPTMAELIGVPPPPETDGFSLAGAMRGGPPPPPRPLFADMLKAHKQQDMIHRHVVLDGTTKVIQGMDLSWSVFDLSSDPAEKHDVAAERTDLATLQSLLTLRDSRRRNTTGWRSRPAPTVAISDADRERMRALGYDP